MEAILIEGGQPLVGTLSVSGAKNTALALLAATLCASGTTVLENVPELADVQVMLEVLASIGVKVQRQPDGIALDASVLTSHTTPYDLVTRMRASFFVLGPILARLGQARIPLPGGCAIGSRPVDLHLKGLRALGAEVAVEHGYAIAKADKLVGAAIYLDYPSVGATETIMMAAALAEGTTTLTNGAQEPEIVDLAELLKAMGARIEGAGTECVRIEGRPDLVGVRHRCIGDRIEAGTFMIAAAATRGDLTLVGIRPEHVASLSGKLQEMGVSVTWTAPEAVRVQATGDLTPVDVRTLPFPGFPTDLQAQTMALLAVTPGTSMLTETVFENRFLHVDELLRMGAHIKTEGNCAVIQGVRPLTGAPVRATDLRAGAALVVAGLAARGTTQITGVHHIDRGYERLEEKLVSVGARITRSGVGETAKP